MENEIQPDITLAQPSLRSLPIIQPSANWSKILLFTVLGLIIVASSVFVGVQIGKNQKPSQQPVAKQQTAAPTQAIANLTIQPTTKPTTDPTANWKTYINTEANYYFKYPQNWTIVSNCKFGTICFSSADFQETVNEVGDGGGFYIASKGGLFSVSVSSRTDDMKLDDFCHPGGPSIIPSCSDTSLDEIAGKKRTEVMENNIEYATEIGTLTNKYFVIVGQNYGSQGDKALLDQILSTFKFNN